MMNYLDSEVSRGTPDVRQQLMLPNLNWAAECIRKELAYLSPLKMLVFRFRKSLRPPEIVTRIACLADTNDRKSTVRLFHHRLNSICLTEYKPPLNLHLPQVEWPNANPTT